MKNPNYFTGNPLNRASDKRKDPEFIAAQLAHEAAQMAVYWRGMPLLQRPAENERETKTIWLSPGAVSQFPRALTPIFLGLNGAIPYFALDVSASAQDPESAPFSDIGVYGHLREFGMILPKDELAILGHGAWLIDWHRRTLFCAQTGEAMESAEGGAKRVAPKAEKEYFPRIDPVAIVLPIHEDACLLGRSPHFPPNMYSALAGFLEPGETLEECAVREIKEEVGVTITDVHYQFSQPWPFPCSLMTGFLASAASRELEIDKQEIEDAIWVPKGEILKVLNGERREDLWVPPKYAIARQLLEVWARS